MSTIITRAGAARNLPSMNGAGPQFCQNSLHVILQSDHDGPQVADPDALLDLGTEIARTVPYGFNSTWGTAMTIQLTRHLMLSMAATGLRTAPAPRSSRATTSSRNSPIPSASCARTLDEIFTRVFLTTGSYPRSQAAMMLHRARFVTKKIMDGRYQWRG